MTDLPEPFNLSLDDFLKGPYNPDAEILVDPMYAKPLAIIVSELTRFDPESYTPAALAETPGSPSTARPGFRFIGPRSGVILLDDRNRIIGAYLGADLALKPAFRRFGLGRELVIERALRSGFMPTWRGGEPSYTKAGLAAHRSAWQYAQDNPDAIIERLSSIG